MWKRAATCFWGLGKRFKNSGKGVDRINHKNEGSTGTINCVENKSVENAVLQVIFCWFRDEWFCRKHHCVSFYFI